MGRRGPAPSRWGRAAWYGTSARHAVAVSAGAEARLPERAQTPCQSPRPVNMFTNPCGASVRNSRDWLWAESVAEASARGNIRDS